MKKLLLTLTLLLTLGFAASAESDPITVSFANTETWTGIKTSGNTETVTATNNGLSFEISNGYWIQSNALFLAKSKGYIVLPAFDAPVTKIEIVGYSGCAKAATVTVSGDDLASTTTAEIKGTTVTVDVNSTTSGVQYKIAANSSANAQIATIKIYVEGTPKCAVPAFNVEDNAEVFAGQVISVNKGNATTCELLVNGEPVEGLEYTIPEDAEIGSAINLTANSTLEGGDPAEASASINVLVVAKPVYSMFDFENEATTTYASWPNGAVTATEQHCTHTINGVVLTADGRLTMYDGKDGWALRLYAANGGVPAGKITLTAPEGYYITSIVFDNDKFSDYTNVDDDITIVSKTFTATATTIVKSIKVYVAALPKLEPEVVLSNVEINHGKVAGVLTVGYTFEIANYNDGEVAVKATIVGMENITFAEVEAPAAAPAREAAGNKVVNGTLKAKDAALKGEQSLIVNVVATLDGKEIYNVNHNEIKTTGIEDVTVDGNEAAEYFNLQGVRVAQPEAGQVYIVRRGAKTTKELVK